ncbi:hypothetical protein [Nitratireductor basaltis]|uniref:Uncharacterized protein n=1 Tax=Nitratireductor basaltis TaxID=472175 RepID=A0A084U9B6_9HYPH|nr:hypothetical protein [Nitratireductor basaltis]KFB09552.1 hypothetical protein EL18_00568 [Nitratireductor basaltis]
MREDILKRRLTDRAQLIVAVETLLNRGMSEERIPIELSRAFYVDMDELNAVLDMMTITANTRSGSNAHSMHAG